MTTLLKTSGLTKDFGNNRGAFDVSLEINSGEIVGFVGPNGAGKSTTINMLGGLVRSDSGIIELFGQVVTANTIYQHMAEIGLLLSEPTLDTKLNAEQTFLQSEQLLGTHTSDQWRAMSTLLDLDVHTPIKKLSLGNKKKVGVINAVMHRPKLIIMDEPTSGLDPLIQAKFTDMLREVASAGSGILLSSHDLNEIQHVCDRILMIKQGRIVLTGATDELLDKAAKVFTLKNPAKALLHQLEKHVPDLTIDRKGNDTVVYTSDYRATIKFLTDQKFYDFYVERPNLETMFKEYYE